MRKCARVLIEPQQEPGLRNPNMCAPILLTLLPHYWCKITARLCCMLCPFSVVLAHYILHVICWKSTYLCGSLDLLGVINIVCTVSNLVILAI